MLKDLEKNFNNRLLDWIIGGSYLGDYRQRFFKKLKKRGLEAYAHILNELDKLKQRYKD